MATPPYENITGIYTIDDKHQAISRADYSGSARPGQIVIDTADYSMWVGTNTGSLVAAGGGGGGGAVTPPAGANTQVQFNNAGAFGGSVGFTFNSTTGTLSAPKFAGNGANLSALPAANIVGTVANATYATSAGAANSVSGANVVGAVTFATTANAVAGANVSGAVANATYAVTAGTANSVAIANVVGAGNIAVLNLNGDGTKVLAGNGAWVTSSGGGANELTDLTDVVLPPGAAQGDVLTINATGNFEFITPAGGGSTATTQDISLRLTTPTIDVTVASYFYYTATTNFTMSVINVPTTTNVVTSFILEITNSGPRITWWPEIKWAGGVVPTLTSTGTDSIAFYSYNDAGTIKWRGLPLGFDIK
jgi:hypothetical protein